MTITTVGDVIRVCEGSDVILLPARHAMYAEFEMPTLFRAYFDMMEPERREGEWVLDCSAPRLHRYRGDDKEYLFTSLPEERDGVEMYFQHYTPHERDLILDAGAYCGYVTIGMARHVRKVVAYEPDPDAREALFENLRQHNVTNVTVHTWAFAAGSWVEAFCNEGAMGSAFQRMNVRPSDASTVKVVTTTLVEEVLRYGAPALLKLDIEGAEVEVLEASRELLKRHVIPNIALDTQHQYKGNATTVAPVTAVLRECGYNVESSTTYGFHISTTWGWL